MPGGFHLKKKKKKCNPLADCFAVKPLLPTFFFFFFPFFPRTKQLAEENNASFFPSSYIINIHPKRMHETSFCQANKIFALLKIS